MVKWKAVSENTMVAVLFDIVVLVGVRSVFFKKFRTLSLQVELLIKMWSLGCLRVHHSVLNMTVPFFFFNISF